VTFVQYLCVQYTRFPPLSNPLGHPAEPWISGPVWLGVRRKNSTGAVVPIDCHDNTYSYAPPRDSRPIFLLAWLGHVA
jgi:hypothetical protein